MSGKLRKSRANKRRGKRALTPIKLEHDALLVQQQALHDALKSSKQKRRDKSSELRVSFEEPVNDNRKIVRKLKKRHTKKRTRTTVGPPVKSFLIGDVGLSSELWHVNNSDRGAGRRNKLMTGFTGLSSSNRQVRLLRNATGSGKNLVMTIKPKWRL